MAAIAAVVLLSVSGARPHAQTAGQEAAISRDRRYLMGTSIEVRAFNGDEATRLAAIEAAFEAFAEVDRLMSNWRSDSELAGLNRGAATAPVVVSQPLFDVIQAAQQINAKSGGAFDVTVAPLLRLWGFYDHKARVPTSAELAAARPLIGAANLTLDPSTKSVRFARPGVEIDLGGIAKGFAVELAAGVLKQRGLGGFIDAGGNVYLLGRPPGKTAWSLGVQDPDRPNEILGTFDLQEGSVSTSANYYNFLTVNGRKYGHHIDPRTLQPTDACLSVTVWSRDGTLADAASTAAFVLGPTRGLAFIDSMPGMMALIVYRGADGRAAIEMSAGLKPLFHRATPR